jgi:hypothetical protein
MCPQTATPYEMDKIKNWTWPPKSAWLSIKYQLKREEILSIICAQTNQSVQYSCICFYTKSCVFTTADMCKLVFSTFPTANKVTVLPACQVRRKEGEA